MQFAPRTCRYADKVFLRWLITVGFDSSNNYVRQLTLSHVRHRRRPPPREYSTRTGCLLHFSRKYAYGFCLFVLTVPTKCTWNYPFAEGGGGGPTSSLG